MMLYGWNNWTNASVVQDIVYLKTIRFQTLPPDKVKLPTNSAKMKTKNMTISFLGYSLLSC